MYHWTDYITETSQQQQREHSLVCQGQLWTHLPAINWNWCMASCFWFLPHLVFKSQRWRSTPADFFWKNYTHGHSTNVLPLDVAICRGTCSKERQNNTKTYFSSQVGEYVLKVTMVNEYQARDKQDQASNNTLQAHWGDSQWEPSQIQSDPDEQGLLLFQSTTFAALLCCAKEESMHPELATSGMKMVWQFNVSVSLFQEWGEMKEEKTPGLNIISVF